MFKVYFNLKDAPNEHRAAEVDNVADYRAARNAVKYLQGHGKVVRALVAIPDCGRNLKNKDVAEVSHNLSPPEVS